MELSDIMERYAIHDVVRLQSFFTSAGTFFSNRVELGIKEFVITAEQILLFSDNAERFKVLLDELGLIVSANAIASVIASLEVAPIQADGSHLRGQNLNNIISGLRSLGDNVGVELSAKAFIAVAQRHASYLDQNAPPVFGLEVDSAFSGASDDIREAACCMALGRHTASVFHLMRAMEISVQTIAEKLGATTKNSNGVMLAWGVLAQNIKTKIDSMPKGDTQTEWYRVHSLFESVNRAWRNKTMHPKQIYTENETEAVFAAVGGFMRALAPVA